MGILPEPPFNFRQNCDHQPKSGDSCLKSPFNLWPYLKKARLFGAIWRPRASWPKGYGYLGQKLDQLYFSDIH